MFQICDMGFGEKIERLREQRGISVRELARQIRGRFEDKTRKLAANTVKRWIDGYVQPRLDEAIHAAEVFGVPLEYLAFDDRPELPGLLADDEAAVLRFYRSLKRRRKLDEDTAIEGLAIAAGMPHYSPGDAVTGRAGKPEPEPDGKARKKGS